MSDLDDVEQNYKELNAAGESWESIAGRVEAVGDKRLAARLRERAAGGVQEARTAPPVERSPGNQAISVQLAADAAAVAETPEQVAAELAAEAVKGAVK